MGLKREASEHRGKERMKCKRAGKSAEARPEHMNDG